MANRPGEWRVGWFRDDDPGSASPTATVGTPRAIEDPDQAFTVNRFLTEHQGDACRLRPLLADRPVVTRPELPLMIPAGDEVKIFVSTPVWVSVELPEPDRLLIELPTQRPSDTWFGPDTRRGVVAYASQTTARLEVSNLGSLPHRAITKVTVRNESDAILPLERICVPAPNLTLFTDRDGSLWTASLSAVRGSGSAPPAIEIAETPPNEAEDATLLAPPRDPLSRNVLSRALHVLVS